MAIIGMFHRYWSKCFRSRRLYLLIEAIGFCHEFYSLYLDAAMKYTGEKDSTPAVSPTWISIPACMGPEERVYGLAVALQYAPRAKLESIIAHLAHEEIFPCKQCS